MADKIETTIKTPHCLIDIRTSSEHFIFQFKEFHNLSDYEIKMGGVTGEFGVYYMCKGINSEFNCDITVGNVYDFYVSLKTAYYISLGKNAVAILKNYGDILNRSNLKISFDNKGHCLFEGDFKNHYNHFKSGINFAFEVDQTYIPEILNSFKVFFNELKRLQGNDTFY